MEYERTPHFKREFKALPVSVQRAFDKQINFLLNDLRHPSLHAKKYDASLGIWQVRITSNVRVYFRVEDDSYILLNIRKHTD